jgi:hypothetical protein
MEKLRGGIPGVLNGEPPLLASIDKADEELTTETQRHREEGGKRDCFQNSPSAFLPFSAPLGLCG